MQFSDFSHLEILAQRVHVPYQQETYKLIGSNVVDGVNGKKYITGFSWDKYCKCNIDLSMLQDHKIVHWSYIDNLQTATPRFYAVGQYNRDDVNEMVVCNDILYREYQDIDLLDIGDLVWFADGLYQYVDHSIELVPVIDGAISETLMYHSLGL